jgi:uncharacterized membrane protein YgcG
MINKSRAYLLFFCLASLHAFAQERITLFDSQITVNIDGSMLVTETIAVRSTGFQIKHGIIREFPTKYQQGIFSRHQVDFEVATVLQDGKQAHYVAKDVANGKKIFIGSPDILLLPGNHTYQISYTTNRQLGFFKDHDELYWNVTGNGWRFPIEKVSAKIILPANIPKDSIAATAYTGYQGEHDKDYRQVIESNAVYFNTTKPLLPRQGLTIAVSWSKGLIAEPSSLQKFYWFIRDNFSSLWMMLGLLLLFIFYGISWLLLKRADKQGTVIPLFHPPKDMAPSAVGFIQNFEFHDSLLAGDIVDLAVQGYITISHSKDQYTLKRTDKKIEPQTSTDSYYSGLLKVLFLDGPEVAIQKGNRLIMNRAIERAQLYCQNFEKHIARQKTANVFTAGVIFCAIWLAILWLLQYFAFEEYFIALAVSFIASGWFVFKFIRSYNPSGRKLKDAIDGFKMYLTTAETERMKVVGTPPTKTPQLYERFLPYAMALGVEEQWSRQFAPIFKRLEQEGHPYIPLWYSGRMFAINEFSNEFSSSLNSAISSSSTIPGDSSGFGRGGSSGGGGGGGGGGGW